MSRKVTLYFPQKPESRGKKRIAAYCRVSTDMDEQLHSLEAQTAFYSKIGTISIVRMVM